MLAWLDAGVDSGGERYLEMRRRLVEYFGRKRCLWPDELADDTLNRVARRLEEEGAVTDSVPARYCYIVARFVFLEYLRRPEHRQASLDRLAPSRQAAIAPQACDAGEAPPQQLLDCLDRCLDKLPPADRALIVDYYRGDQRARIEQRRELAARLQISPNALAIRACRLRDKVQDCVRACATAG